MADVDYAALWRSLTPAQRRRLMGLSCGPTSKAVAPTYRRVYERLLDTDPPLAESTTDASGWAEYYTLTDLGRALAAWAAEHGEAVGS